MLLSPIQTNTAKGKTKAKAKQKGSPVSPPRVLVDITSLVDWADPGWSDDAFAKGDRDVMGQASVVRSVLKATKKKVPRKKAGAMSDGEGSSVDIPLAGKMKTTAKRKTKAKEKEKVTAVDFDAAFEEMITTSEELSYKVLRFEVRASLPCFFNVCANHFSFFRSL